jgi:hypothetical protein
MDPIERLAAFLFTGLALSWIVIAVLVLNHLESIGD